MSTVGLFDVIWAFDRTIDPQGWKMHVCLDHDRGWFMRINTANWHKPCVPIAVADNPFLKHDSHVQCVILELDEYEIEEALTSSGIIGRVCDDAKVAVLEKFLADRSVKQQDKDHLKSILS